MKSFKILSTFIVLLIAFTACETDNAFDYIAAPTDVSAVFNVTQDNTGLVTITPNAVGAYGFVIDFGDASDTEEVAIGESVDHVYTEGVYTVSITAKGIAGKMTTVTQELTVTFRAPENLQVGIVVDQQNPRLVTVTPTADFAMAFDVYFGEGETDVPIVVNPGGSASNTYGAPGDYTIRVVARSAGAATTEFTQIVTIAAATDPVNLPIGFESLTINYAFTDFGGTVSSVVDNPNMTGINTSNKVGRSHKTSGAEVWAGSFLTLENPIDFSVNRTFRVKVWSPKANAVVKLKVENLTDGNISSEVDVSTTVANEWEELSFDFSSIDTNNSYQKVVIFFDFGNAGDDSMYYFDDIELVPSTLPAYVGIQDFEGTAPAFTVFGNIAAVEVVSNPDATGENTTANVAKLTKTNGAETWAGAFFETTPALNLTDYSHIRVKTWSPKVGAVVKLKIENADASITHEVDINTSVANSWEELSYDFSGAPDAEYVKVVIFFDFGNSGDGAIYYYDEIILANEDAPSTPPLNFEDFEGDAPMFTNFDGGSASVIDNPQSGGINTSAKVGQMIKNGGQPWAGSYFSAANPIDFTNYSNVKIKVWSNKVGTRVLFKVENNDDASINYEVEVATTVANQWEELTFDYSGINASNSYHKVVLIFDNGTTGDGSANFTYYFDDIQLTN